jgi:ABC-type sugar transport system ATPase subunit
MSDNIAKPVLQIENVTKNFPGVCALDNVSLKAYSGEVVGLAGANGAGKSTLMKIVDGALKPSEGRILLDGQEVRFSSPMDAEAAGIAFIHQELVLFSHLTVAENVFISELPTYKALPFVDRSKIFEETGKYLGMLGSTIDPRLRVRELSMGDRQVVEVARALSRQRRLFLFDEPTSSLSTREKELLFEKIRWLKSQNVCVIYISHFLDEMAEITDRMIVMRDGRVVGEDITEDLSTKKVIRMMIGKDIDLTARVKQSAVREDVVLKVEGLSSHGSIQDVGFSLRKGEVVGLWGLLGSGRSETIRSLVGLDPIDSGEIWLEENESLQPCLPSRLLRRSGYLTEDRHNDGLFLSLPVWQNISAASLKSFARGFFRWMDTRKEEEEAQKFVKSLNIRTSSVKLPAAALSGGNQQKVVLAKWLERQPPVLFLDEPTRGVDVGAKLEIHNLIAQLAQQGIAILLVSSEIEEILSLSDRILMMKRGRLTAELNASEATKEGLMTLVTGEVSDE